MKAALLVICLTPLFASLAQAAPPATTAQTTPDPNELTTAAAVRQLTPEQAAKKLPVRIRGVVTYLSANPQILYVQDATGGVCIAGPRDRDVRPLRPGTSVEIEGVTTPGRLVPAVVGRLKEPVKITILGEGLPLPAPKAVTVSQLAHREFHGDLVEVEAVVRSVRNESTGAAATEALVITLGTGRDRIEAAFLAWHNGTNYPPNLVGATVKIRGVFNSASPEKQQTAAMRLLFAAIKDLRILEPGTPPFDLPITSITALRSTAPEETLPVRARVEGIVTLAVPRKGLFLQGDGGALWIDAPTDTLRAGDHAEVVGFPARRGSTTALEDVVSRPRDRPGLPDAPLITPEQALSGDFDARLVRMEALVLEVSRLSEGPTLVLQSGERVFLARIAGAPTADTLDPFRQDSWVRLTGVCVHNRLPETDTSSPPPPTAKAVSFHLLLNSPQAIDVIHAPSWWTLGRFLMVCGVLVVITMAAFAWVALLRLRVARQTDLLRTHLARETLYEERVRIARELHDSLEQDLLGISMQLNATDKLLTNPDRARESLLLASAMVRRSQAETHRAVWDLRTNSDGLVSTLRQAVAALDPVTVTQVVFDVQGQPRDLPAAAQNHVVRVALEAVTNALKHANPSRIQVQLDFTDPKQLILTVRDDGKGFDDQRLPPPSSGHFGLFGMRERADKLEGQLTIQSSPGKGTQIQLRVPTPPEDSPLTASRAQ